MQHRNVVPLAAFTRAPLMTKLVIMARMLVNNEEGLTAIAKLIALVVTMAACMSAEVRLAVADQLRSEADLLAPPFNRRALH
jgi:hypothetical protein